jgi:hypothetical protein
LIIGALYFAVREPLTRMGKIDILTAPTGVFVNTGVIVSLLVILWLIYRAAVNFNSLPPIVRRHPQIALHLLYWSLLASLWLTSSEITAARTMLIGIAAIFPFLIWRCGYLLLSAQHGRIANTSFGDHLLCLWPAFGGSNTPYGKGLDYLSKFEAKTTEELKRSQRSGIKLLLLSGLWGVAKDAMKSGFYGSDSALAAYTGSEIPFMSAMVSQGAEAPIVSAWLSIYSELFYQVFKHAANGHQVVGILRLFGFNVFRNTYKPLLAESIAEFWNRYYYYFKELLVTFFFMPTFMRLGNSLKQLPTVRLFAAVFAAAFVGNMYYHMLSQYDRLVTGQLFDVLYALRSRSFYCLLLAGGIFVSMYRAQRRRSQPVSSNRLARSLRIFGVWTFFSLIFIWDVSGGGDFSTRVAFFFRLFGLSLP